jgi:septal ring factor EnvC (AmiA/AmiB activator)
MPLSGSVLTGYNEMDSIGARSKGITVQGRKNALIVAPMGGIIRFTGAFKNYGNMIIVEHKNNYHSLISGFKDINVSVGQNVSAGQPLGRLKDNQGNKAPKLYFELRRNGKPLNPSKVIGGIG